MKEIRVELGQRSYDIILKRGCTNELSAYLDCSRRYFIVSDDGVPQKLQQKIAAQLPNSQLHVVKQGEGAKSFAVYEEALRKMVHEKYTRRDCVIALGGGVVGDLSGFIAASYMRGIDFIQIPTTTLSQIDSSIGGKVAINVDQVKNCVGAFWQPKKVLIDPDTLQTLTRRHFNNGLVEALKAGCLADERLVELFESGDIEENLEEILYRSLVFKKNIVEQDETETSLRRILNFGHTLGHGIESYYHLSEVYHGEAVALGMMLVIKDEAIRRRLRKIYARLNLKTEIDYDPEQVFEFIQNDKKGKSTGVSMILLPALQKPVIEEKSWAEIEAMLKEGRR